jgi:hypothetical protein
MDFNNKIRNRSILLKYAKLSPQTKNAAQFSVTWFIDFIRDYIRSESNSSGNSNNRNKDQIVWRYIQLIAKISSYCTNYVFIIDEYSLMNYIEIATLVMRMEIVLQHNALVQEIAIPLIKTAEYLLWS